MEETALTETTVSMMQARQDPSPKAIVQKGVPLFYSQGADPTSDRPAHVPLFQLQTATYFWRLARL